MKNSVSSTVYNAVINDIFNSRYKAGDILTERALIDEYGCSKTSVREALVALCHTGILRSIPRYGYEVLRVERSEVTDILEYRYVLESGCMARCIEGIVPRHILRLREVNEHCRQAQGRGDLWAFWDCNAQFHLELIRLSGNRYAEERLRAALDTLKRAFVQYYWTRPEDAFQDCDCRFHEEMLTALRAHDLAAAGAALGGDLKQFAY